MSTITAIEVQQGNQQRVNIYLDGQYAFSLDVFVSGRENLRVGLSLSEAEVDDLVLMDEGQRCYDAAVHFLGYRPRSELEVSRRLLKRGFKESVVEATLARLREQRFLDDAAFAKFWLDNRQAFNPRGERLLKQELRQKGVDSEIAREITSEIDETEAAYQAAGRKARSLASYDYREFRQRLGAFLQRRGFSYETIAGVTARLWREAEAAKKQ